MRQCVEAVAGISERLQTGALQFKFLLLPSSRDVNEANTLAKDLERFKDFIRTFKSVMNSMNSRLDNIAQYTSEFLEISKKGLEEANTDRDMAKFYTEQHRDWEKRMHFRDKGYQ